MTIGTSPDEAGFEPHGPSDQIVRAPPRIELEGLARSIRSNKQPGSVLDEIGHAFLFADTHPGPGVRVLLLRGRPV